MRNLRFAICDLRWNRVQLHGRLADALASATHGRDARATQSKIQNPTSKIRTAFTLVEVMISMALVLVLMLGVNQIFTTTADVVGHGQALSTVVRDNRAVQSVLYNDFRVTAPGGGPSLTISSSVTAAFRNRADELGDIDYSQGTWAANAFAVPTQARDTAIRTVDLNNDGTEGENTPGIFGENPGEPGEHPSPFVYNERNHRTDILSLFGRDLFRRQTGNDGSFVGATTSTEAWIWYGHLNRPAVAVGAGSGSGIAPGYGTSASASNPGNFYTSDWTMGRMAMLLVAPEDDGDGVINDADNMSNNENHYPRSAATDGTQSTIQMLSPLAYWTRTKRTGFQSEVTATIQTSRYDLAATTIDQVEQDIVTASGPTPAAFGEHWWQKMLLHSGSPSALPNAAAIDNPLLIRDYRFWGEPLFTRPLDSASAARMSPILLTGCSQLIVEYAGNYVAQNPADGSIVAANGKYTAGILFTDTETDYVVEDVEGPGGAVPVRRTRWYGMWRDDNGDGEIEFDGTGDSGGRLPDVMPLGYFMEGIGGAPADFPSHERVMPDTNVTIDNPTSTRYICVWGPPGSYASDPDFAANMGSIEPPRPQMIRITVVLDDPNGRLAEGQKYEYVFRMP